MSVRVIFLEKNPDEESINYYFSKDPMNPDNMPAPISVSGPSEILPGEPDYGSEAVGWTVDWDREEDAYVRVGVVKNGIEALSNEWVYVGSSGITCDPWSFVFPENWDEWEYSSGYASFNYDDSLLAIPLRDDDSPLKVYDTKTFEPIEGIPKLAGNGEYSSFSPDGSTLAVAHRNSPYVTFINTSDWSIIPGTPDPGDNIIDIAFTNSGEYVVLAGSTFMVLRTSDWSIVETDNPRGSSIVSIDISPCDGYLGVGGFSTFGDRISFLSIPDFKLVSNSPYLASRIGSVGFTEEVYNNEYGEEESVLFFYASDDEDNILKFSEKNWEAEPTVVLNVGIRRVKFSFSSDYKFFATSNREINRDPERRVTVYRVSDWSKISEITDITHNTAEYLNFSNNSKYLFLGYNSFVTGLRHPFSLICTGE